MKRKRVQIPLKNEWILDIYLGNYKEVEKEVHKRGCDIDLSKFHGMVWAYESETEGLVMCIWIENKRNYPIINHECLHALYLVSDYTKWEINKKTQEWQCSFVEWLTREIISM